MRQLLIVYPVLALVGWTLLVLGLMGFRRVMAGRAGRVRSRDFALGESAQVPADVAVVNRNYMNLLEVPILFYVVCLAYFVTRKVDLVAVGLAWAFVGLRIVHSGVHIGYNNVMHRLAVFALANFTLIGLWGLLLVRLAR